MFGRILNHLRRNAVAYLALCVALGGTSCAASRINGADLKNRSVAGKKLKRNTVGGTVVKESKLGKVPAAAQADSAADAAALGGTRKSGFQRASKWALVRGSDGKVLAGSAGIKVDNAFDGGYYIDFGSPTTRRPILVSLRYNEQGIIAAAPCGAPGPPGAIPCLQPGTNDRKHAFVQTRDLKGKAADMSFYISVQAP